MVTPNALGHRRTPHFATVGTAIVAGRDFNERDGAGSSGVIAINEEASRRFFAGEDPIGQTLVWGEGDGQQGSPSSR
jgi:cyanophycinase-like exopeptidase